MGQIEPAGHMDVSNTVDPSNPAAVAQAVTLMLKSDASGI
jgi:hypothetical protein